ncbi:MAG: fasciclin domain-containing protein [Fimbriimonadaceae bacterium]|nr:fasciclin domain-containing protein [Fimbriimonadaceae bacterium]QYK54896.1 MAG: fasciclin domain-containing protein [Fimbriimonadaceae bacterium]
MTSFNKLGATLLAVAAISMSATAMAPNKDIVDTAAGNHDFSTLVSLVKEAGLVETLKGKGPFTVFAPTNEAFKKLPKATLEAVKNDKQLLKNVLLYHVVPGKVTADQVVKTKSAGTALGGGATLKFTVKNGKVFINDKTRVVKTDVMATNGVIHVIDSVLIPPKK